MKKYVLFYFLSVVIAFTSCKKDLPELGDKLSSVTYSVTKATAIDENTFILENKTPGTVAIWDYQTGKSNRQVDTVHYAFKGTYTIKFSALTAGGIVKADSTIVTVDADNLQYVSDPLWAMLAGGVGKSKTWIPDNGKYGKAATEFGYADPSRNQVWGDFATNWEPDAATVGVTSDDLACKMTFDLIGGANLTTVKPNEPGATLTGTFFLDASAHTLTTTGTTIIRTANNINKVSNWGTAVRVLLLDENQLRIAIFRDNSPAEGTWWFVYNYVSEEYAKSYVPLGADIPDDGYNPLFAKGELVNMLTGGAGGGRAWVLDATGNPIDWVGKGKGWTKDYTSTSGWGWDAGKWDSVANNSWISFDQIGGLHYTRNQCGTITKGTFTVDEDKNEIYLSDGENLITNSKSWMPSTGNTIKVVKAWNADYATKGLWLSVSTSYNATKDEWMCFHYIMTTTPTTDEGFNPQFLPGELFQILTGGTGSATSWHIDATGNPVDWIKNGKGWTTSYLNSMSWGWSQAWADSTSGAWISFDNIDGQNVFHRYQNGKRVDGTFSINESTNEITLSDNLTILTNTGHWMSPSTSVIKVVKAYNDRSRGLWLGTSYDAGANQWLAWHYVPSLKK